tara:strand:+ start:28 stop:276 length:249 start_codon:yes stop_codon:yes gene_type:complete
MKTEKTYTHQQVSNIVKIFADENKELALFKSEIKRIMYQYVSNDRSDENILRQVELMCIQRMHEDDEKIEQEKYRKFDLVNK